MSARASRWRRLATEGIVWLKHKGVGLSALRASREEQQTESQLVCSSVCRLVLSYEGSISQLTAFLAWRQRETNCLDGVIGTPRNIPCGAVSLHHEAGTQTQHICFTSHGLLLPAAPSVYPDDSIFPVHPALPHHLHPQDRRWGTRVWFKIPSLPGVPEGNKHTRVVWHPRRQERQLKVRPGLEVILEESQIIPFSLETGWDHCPRVLGSLQFCIKFKCFLLMKHFMVGIINYSKETF